MRIGLPQSSRFSQGLRKTQLVFGLIDTKHLNRIGEAELEDTLTRLKKNLPPNASSIPRAKSLIEIFATTTSNDLAQDQFESVIEGLAASSIDCSFDDMCNLLLISLLFSDSGMHVLQEVVKSVAGKSSCDLEEAMSEARMMILFDAMDEEQEGYVYLKDLIKSLYRLTEDMGNLEQESIFMLREKSLRRLDYELFCEVLSTVLEGIHRTVDDVADELTLSISSGSIGDEEIKHLLLSDSFVMAESASSSETEDGKENPEYGQEKSYASWSSGLGFPRIHAKSARL
jgi:Ca2+-binding EF-hand superfamily protein